MKTDDYRRKNAEQAEIDYSKYDEDSEDFPLLDLECYMTEPAKLDDLEELCEVHQPNEVDLKWREMLTREIRKGHVKLTADSERVIAYSIFDYSFKKHQGIVKWLLVHEEYRRQGVGTDILMGLEGVCSTRCIYAAIPRRNLAAQELFKSFGYAPARGEAFRGPLDDPEEIYVKDIRGRRPERSPETIQ